VGSYDKTECVFDSSTGLTWEGKPTSGVRSTNNIYTNLDNSNSLQITTYGALSMPTQAQIDASSNSIGYVNAVNAMSLCGYSNWRVPTLNELLTINVGASNSVNQNLTTDMVTWFPNLYPSGYWTSTPDAANSVGAYTFILGTNAHYQQYRIAKFPIRLVR
jgi:Protein of unknown function (DUF1566)